MVIERKPETVVVCATHNLKILGFRAPEVATVQE